jgi:hypothetical protein
MKAKATLLLSCLAFALCILPARTPAYAQAGAGIDSTHFWTYKLLQPNTQPVPGVQASDQFFMFPIPITPYRQARLLNWVYKNNSTVRDTLVHYTWWDVQEQVTVNRNVIVDNQFGRYEVTVDHLSFMLVPTRKNTDVAGGPLQANHYLCYKTHGFPAPGLPYSMQDEWRHDFVNPGPIEFLCAPCFKYHNGNTFPILDPNTHLAAYPINTTSESFSPFLSNQFTIGGVQVQAGGTEYIFVPSVKIEDPTPTLKSSWGKIKLLYR